MDQFEGMTRFQGDSRSSYQQFLDGAVGYPHGLSDSEKLGFRQKPFDWNEGHPSFFNNSFQLLNGSYRPKLVTAGIGKAAYRGGA